MHSNFRSLVDQLKAIAHPLRLRVLGLLAENEFCVCQVAEVMEVPLSSVSEALRELRRAGFTRERKEGRWVFVSSVPDLEASPLLRGLMAELRHLPEFQADQQRAQGIRSLSVAEVCGRAQQASKVGVSHG